MKNPVIRAAMGALALLSLAVCLVMAVLVFLGRVSEGTYKTAFLAGSILWFVFSIFRGRREEGSSAGPNGA
jgi:hypothetical protein